MQYVIETTDQYTKRPSFLAGIDEVTRAPIWAPGVDVAVRFADHDSAQRFNSEAWLGRVARIITI